MWKLILKLHRLFMMWIESMAIHFHEVQVKISVVNIFKANWIKSSCQNCQTL